MDNSEKSISRKRRGVEEDDEGEKKKHKFEIEDHHSDRRDRDNKYRYSSSSSSSSRGVERDSDRDRDRRDRDRDRDRDRSGREKDGEREKIREKYRGDDKDRERESSRRSSSHSRRDHGGGSGREKDGEREKIREKDREWERSRRSSSHLRRHRSSGDSDVDVGMKDLDTKARAGVLREREETPSRRSKDKKEAQKPEANSEKDERTVLVSQIPLKATGKDVFNFFSKAGQVSDVRLQMDRNGKRFKGFAYVEFSNVKSVPMALNLSGHDLMGQLIMVKPCEAEKDLAPYIHRSWVTDSLPGSYGEVARKLYVGNLPVDVTEPQVRKVFEHIGPVENVTLTKDPKSGLGKGFVFVQFAKLEHAKKAQSLNGKVEIDGQFIKVSAVTDHLRPEIGYSSNPERREMIKTKLSKTAIDILNASHGVSALNGSGFPSADAPPTAGMAVGIPSQCLLLKNMFDPDIRKEVEEECSKYGALRHIHVDNKSSGYVYLRYESTAMSIRAQQSWHMRLVGGKSIVAVFMEPEVYEIKFPGSGLKKNVQLKKN